MNLTPADHLGAVERALTTITRDGRELRLLTVTRTYDASLDDVWDALTTRERITRWMMPVSGDLEVGGRYQLEGNAGGEVLECVPPERLALTWEYDGQVSWVDLSLRPTESGTLLQLDHSAPVPPEMWEQFGPGAVGIGWEMGLMGLAEHLAAPDAERPPRETVPDLGEYLWASSAAWGEVDISAGADPETARAAARRTAEAYTAAPED
ncbi:SRPBCC family protein [Nocardioides sp. cx-173]|uniref:SRPBCC family protein n=1 Tax=Nocardioides sp. cx-173 TaxID=2898796 RepID=UPI001E653090|nr:SRPBCC family protein [Nocardioides sp. cx-173]MCD4524696.1 SRPBCC family protein [Nocardioides sp. cx-173]UGB43206.1 SRPBCC family protein [Nocardioides sp. cx-173]